MIGPADSQNFRKYWPEGRNGWEFYQGRPRHQGGMNFVYADGHSKWARATDTPGNRPDYEKGYYPVLMSDGRFPTQAACERCRGRDYRRDSAAGGYFPLPHLDRWHAG